MSNARRVVKNGVGAPSKQEQIQALGNKIANIGVNHFNAKVDAMTAKGAASIPASGNPTDIGASGKTVGRQPASRLATTQLEGMTVTPPDDDFDEWRRQDTNAFLSTPVAAAVGFVTGTNPWQQNAPGDDSIQSATMPGAWDAGLKGAAVGFGILRNVARAEAAYEVLSDIWTEALRFLSTGREAQVYLGARAGETA